MRIKKKKGFIQIYIMGIGALFLLLLVLYLILIRQSIPSFLYGIKDQCDMTNLATYKQLNEKELGRTGNIIFSDEDVPQAFDVYLEYLKDNLQLDNSLRPKVDSFITDSIVVNKIILYSVNGGLTTAYEYDSTTKAFSKVYDNSTQILYTPNNKKVEYTSVYSDIKVKVKFENFTGEHTIIIPSYTAIVR